MYKAYLVYRYGSSIDDICNLFKTDTAAYINDKQAEHIVNAINEDDTDRIVKELSSLYAEETMDSNLDGLREHIKALFDDKIQDIDNLIGQLEEETRQRLGDD